MNQEIVLPSNQQPPAIFITGIAGMVGSHFVDFLLANTSWSIHGLIRWDDPLNNIEHLLPQIESKNRLFLYYGDLNDASSLIHILNNIPNLKYVSHLAAQSYPHVSFTMPIETLNTNILGTAKLMDALHKTHNRDVIIHNCSSSEVFGRVDEKYLPIDEETPFQPASPYAISKAGTDLIGRYYGEAFGLKIISSRMFTHTGPRRGDVFHESSFAKQIALIEAGIKEPVIKHGNLSSLRTYADVRDAVRAYYMLLTINPIAGEYYNIGGNYTCTVKETLLFLISLSPMANEIKLELDPERIRPLDADLQVPDCTKFYNHTGWKPEIDYRDTMADLLDYWRERIGSGRKFLSR
jgi:GDPmannose 4,6-dehydratase